VCLSLNASQKGLRRVHRARRLLVPQRAYTARGADPILRSGLYIIRTFTSTVEEQIYVLYWPEDATWDDNAASTAQRNRVTFMRYGSNLCDLLSRKVDMSRYLTKLCDQLVCLLSAEHAKAIVWGDDVDEVDDASSDSDNDDSDWLYDYTVAKTNEQEENVIARQGFTVRYLILATHALPVLTSIIGC
jgi:hypothetical protein